MNKVQIKECPVCNNNAFQLLFPCKDLFATGEIFNIFTCNKCHFSFTQNFPSESEIAPYYNVSEYISHSDTSEGILNKLYHLARNLSLSSKRRLICKHAQNVGSLLDYGCGTGYFLNEMKKHSWTVDGIEKSPTARQMSIDKFDIESKSEDFKKNLKNNSFDVITLWHVLEHVEKLNDIMTFLSNVLKDDGILVIALPNNTSFDSCHYKQDWAAYDTPRHLWHFSPDNFKEFANKHSYELIQIKPMLFDAMYVSMLSERGKGKRSMIVSNLLGLTKGCYFSFLSIFNIKKSSSIIYILRKKKK